MGPPVVIEPGRGVKMRMLALSVGGACASGAVSEKDPLRAPPIRSPRKQHPARRDAAGRFRRCPRASASSQCEPLLSRDWLGRRSDEAADEESRIRETSQDCEQQRREQATFALCVFELEMAGGAASRSGSESRSNTSPSGVVARSREYSDTGGRTKLEIPPAGCGSGASFSHLTQLYSLIQQRARRARLAET